MQMTNEEIIKEYREAKNKKQQIKILADLNTCDANVIKEILIEAGEAAPRVYRAAKKPEEKKTTKAAEQELPTAIIKSLTMRMNEIGAAITLQEAKIEELKQERQDIADFLAAHK